MNVIKKGRVIDTVVITRETIRDARELHGIDEQIASLKNRRAELNKSLAAMVKRKNGALRIPLDETKFMTVSVGADNSERVVVRIENFDIPAKETIETQSQYTKSCIKNLEDVGI